MSSPVNPEPLAIVGIGCRLPGGANDAESFWKLLAEGRSGIREVPADRWNLERFYHPDPAAAGAMVTRWGGFVEGLDMFDARFWGVSPREAMRMDPQQRWLLEVAWESIEDSGTAPQRLRGRNIGVFVGISANDYGGLQLPNLDDVDAYTNSGSTLSIASNRISYMLDLRGPSMSVDTACSSSLVAVWLACSNIWSGNCAAALAGGVNALITPHSTVGFSKASMVSPNGQCFAFDARANGYVRAEGAGMVFLKPLAEAVADRNRIYAVIRAAVVNQDGHTSSMTVPSVDAQTAMLRQAYRQARIAPADVAYVEAHGTGTPVGDPIEARALGRVVGEGRLDGAACLIGSVKTNIGHLEAGSGIAALMKAALVLDRRTVPASLNYEHPNPHIPFEELRLEVASRTQPLPSSNGQPPVVSVNSFGFGGTNAHVVLEAAPAPPAKAPNAGQDADRPCVLPISARDETALRQYVQAYRELLAHTPDSLADVCASAGERKDHHPHRLVVIGADAGEMRTRAAAWLRDGGSAGVVAGRATAAPPPVFVFTGQGAQWWAMGQQLLKREPLFRRTVEAIDARLRRVSGWSLIAEMTRAEADSSIDRTDIAQPAIFALQAGLVELWKQWGITPARVIGHSVGEVAAAYCAGVYSLEDAVTIIFHRSRLQHATRQNGGMLAAGLSPADAQRAIGDDAGRIELAAINSPRLVTLSGDAGALDALDARLQSAGVFSRRLRIAYAFHSRQMDPIRDELLHALAGIQPRASTIPFVSTVTGEPLAGERLDAAYWWDNVRQPVLFGPAISRLVRVGHETFVEIGPAPALESALRENLAEQGRSGAVLHSLRRDTDESNEMLANLAGLHLLGAPVDWRAVNRSGGSPVRLPAYPWHRESFWLESPAAARARLAPPVHPLLGLRVAAPQPTWELKLDLHRLSYLKDHRIWDTVVFPGAAYGEMGLALARELFPEDPHAVEDLEIKKALFIGDADAPTLQVQFTAEDKSFRIYSAIPGAAAGDDGWELHAQGKLTRLVPADLPPVDLDAIRGRLANHFSHDQYCHEFAIRGYQFGPSFLEVQNLWRGPGEALVEIEAPGPIADEAGDYCFHPALQDACFHSFIGLRVLSPGARPEDDLFLPQSVRRIQLRRDRAPVRLWAHTRLVADAGTSMLADILVYDDHGRPVADILGFGFSRLDPKRTAGAVDDCCYRFTWQPRRLRGSGVNGSCAFPPAVDIVSAARASAGGIRERHALDAYYRQFVPQMDAAARQFAQRAFRDLGWPWHTGDQFSLDTFAGTLGIGEDYRRVTRRVLRHLETHGWLRSSGDDAWEVLRLPDAGDEGNALDALSATYPAFDAEIALLRRTGPHLAAVLSGETDPLDLLFPRGSQEQMERFYGQAMALPAHLELMGVGVARAVASVPPARAVRVLEVGAGTGALTRTVLPMLPRDRTEYLFTDVGAAFLASARPRLAEFPFVDYQVFDLEKDPRTQGIPAGRFDLILASDVLHATADVRRALAHLRTCLAPGGLLMFLELVAQDVVRGDVTFGLLKGYSRFSDTGVRRDSPLLNREQWTALLAECGFEDSASFSCVEDEHEVEHAALIAFAPADAGAIAQAAPAAGTKPYVLFADKQGVADALSERLQQLGHRTVLVRQEDAFHQVDERSFQISAASEDDIRRVLGAAAIGADDLAGVIHCWSLDHPPADGIEIAELRAAQQTGVLSAFRLVRALSGDSTRVWFVTRDVHRVADTDRAGGLASSPLIGLARVANSEHQCRFSLVDLDDCARDDAAEQLLAEITLPGDGELETAYRGGVRHALRLERLRLDQLPNRHFDAVRPDRSVTPYRLQTDAPGILANLALHETTRRAPGPDDVEVRVLAGGINFRDVMKALGTHPGKPMDLLWLGDDFAGVVERVGEQVDRLQAGDHVAGIAPRAFGSYATTDARVVFRKPARMSFEEAATVPTVFLTAYAALRHLARLQPGERILIHAGTGGVGQAAIQIAKHLSLEIFATAGTDAKRQLLTDLGVPHVMNSRTLDFADEIMAVTGGRGVDAVLNSLAGEFIPKSLSVLAPFGRFIEIGKVDIYRNAKIGLQPLRNNVSYFVLDLTQYLRERPAVVVQMLAELGERFAAGDYQPLPYTAFPVTQAADAFRFMAQGKHVGKNVLTFDLPTIPIAFSTDDDHRFRADATYLITGGAGGFGLEVAKWIARHGGRHLVLLSRSGPRDARARADIEHLLARGIIVVDARGDVTRPEDVERAVGQIGAELPPLRGVFHAAMVLDDDFVAALDERRVHDVLEPKMAGAWNLHAATAECPLDHFVCFSSFSAVIGMLKQASYNAGNVFLDTLAHYRRARGLPALTVAWGALLGAGFVERNQKTADALIKFGFGALQVEEALRILGRLLFVDPVHAIATRANWPAVLKVSPLVASSQTYASVARAESGASHEHGSLASRLHAAGPEERARLVQDFIVAEVAGVFGMTEDAIDRTASLTTLGLDSLMTLELTNRVERELGLRMAMATLLGGPSIVELSATLLHLLAAAGRDAGEVDGAAADPPTSLTADAVRHEEDQPANHVVVIRAGGDSAPLFAFHPVGGGVGMYASLVPYLPEDIPVYGVESRLMLGAQREFSSVDEMVHAYVTAVRGIHPGPYRLVGHSLGGYLAARVAEVLEQEGEQVDVVGVIDWDARRKVTVDAQRESLMRMSVATYRFMQEVTGLVRPLPEERLQREIASLVEEVLTGTAGSDAFARWVVDNRLTTNDSLEGVAREYLVRFEQHCRLLTHELPLPRIRAPLIVWRARDGFGSRLDSWEHTGDAREHVFDGDHHALMRLPAVRAIAEQVTALLDREPVVDASAPLAGPLPRVRRFGERPAL